MRRQLEGRIHRSQPTLKSTYFIDMICTVLYNLVDIKAYHENTGSWVFSLRCEKVLFLSLCILNYERQVDPFIVHSRFVSPQELSEIPCLVDRRCLVVNNLLNYESLGDVHQRDEIGRAMINKWRSKRARSKIHTFPAHEAPTTRTLIDFISTGRG